MAGHGSSAEAVNKAPEAEPETICHGNSEMKPGEIRRCALHEVPSKKVTSSRLQCIAAHNQSGLTALPRGSIVCLQAVLCQRTISEVKKLASPESREPRRGRRSAL